MNQQEKKALSITACKVRMGVIEGTYHAKSGHPGGSLSFADIFTYLYFKEMNIDPKDIKMPERDRFILSKGHGAVCMYITMALRGFFDYDEIVATYGKLDSAYGQHPCKVRLPGVETSTGSLGHGLAICVGMAAHAKMKKASHRVFCMMGDGETCEGSVWEAAINGRALKLGNLVAIVDQNRLQATGVVKERFDTTPLVGKWEAFGWNVKEIDGHDMWEILTALDTVEKNGRPTVIIAHTVKGKGVSFAENVVSFHNSTLSQEQYNQALAELA
mgnify:CR=1 FL=1